MPNPDRSRYEIVPIGSLHTGFALTVDGIIRRSAPDMLSLAAWVDAVLAGADEFDANLIAQAIAARAWPSYEERLAIFNATGPWQPSVDPFNRQAPEPRPDHRPCGAGPTDPARDPS
jgi:hypothetical protein